MSEINSLDDEELFNLKIVSQTQVLYDGAVYSVSVPTTTGIINILLNHGDLISILTLGTLFIKKNKTSPLEKLLVSGGIIKIEENNVVILSDEAVLSKNLVLQEIEKAISNAKDSISVGLPPAELIQLQKQLEFNLFKRDFLARHKLT